MKEPNVSAKNNSTSKSKFLEKLEYVTKGITRARKEVKKGKIYTQQQIMKSFGIQS